MITHAVGIAESAKRCALHTVQPDGVLVWVRVTVLVVTV